MLKILSVQNGKPEWINGEYLIKDTPNGEIIYQLNHTKYQYDLYKHQDGTWRFKTNGFPVNIGFTNSVPLSDNGGMKSIDTAASCPQDVDGESWIDSHNGDFGHKFYRPFGIACKITCEQTDSCWG